MRNVGYVLHPLISYVLHPLLYLIRRLLFGTQMCNQTPNCCLIVDVTLRLKSLKALVVGIKRKLLDLRLQNWNSNLNVSRNYQVFNFEWNWFRFLVIIGDLNEIQLFKLWLSFELVVVQYQILRSDFFEQLTYFNHDTASSVTFRASIANSDHCFILAMQDNKYSYQIKNKSF